MKENLLLVKDALEPWKSKIYKNMTSISKIWFIDKLDDIIK